MAIRWRLEEYLTEHPEGWFPPFEEIGPAEGMPLLQKAYERIASPGRGAFTLSALTHALWALPRWVDGYEAYEAGRFPFRRLFRELGIGAPEACYLYLRGDAHHEEVLLDRIGFQDLILGWNQIRDITCDTVLFDDSLGWVILFWHYDGKVSYWKNANGGCEAPM